MIDSNDIQHDDAEETSHAARSRHEVNEMASQRLVEFLKSFEMDRSRIHSHLSFGTPWKEIHQMVQHHKVDLIAMGTVGRSGVKGLFFGQYGRESARQLRLQYLDHETGWICLSH